MSETKDYTIYVDVSEEPDACASCGSAAPMLSVTLPIPDSDPYPQWRTVPKPEAERDGVYDRFATKMWVVWSADLDAWRCAGCGALHLVPDDDGERVVTLPVKMEVCSRCEGHGYHLTPSIGEHAYSQEEFYEAFDDEEDRAEYFRRGGIYDVRCYDCKGANVVPVVDESACARDPRLARDLALARKHWENEADARAESAAEMRAERMMCGDY